MVSSKERRYNKMEMIKVFNDHTGEILEKRFVDPADADDFEFILDFLEAKYERYHNGEQIY